MKRLFISLLLLLTPFVLIQGKGSLSDEHLEGLEQEYLDRLVFLEKTQKLRRKEILKLRYQLHRISLKSKIRVNDLRKKHNAPGLHNFFCIFRRNGSPVESNYSVERHYLEKIAPEVIKDIDCDPNNEAIILDSFCMDPEEIVNDSNEVKNEKVSTCKAFFIKFFSEYRERVKKTKEDNQEK